MEIFFEDLKVWLQKELKSYKSGAGCSFAESIHGENIIGSVLNKIEQLESTIKQIKWSKEKPHIEGFYWFYNPDGTISSKIIMVYVWDINESGLHISFIGTDESLRITEFDDLWLGPLLVPTLPNW